MRGVVGGRFGRKKNEQNKKYTKKEAEAKLLQTPQMVGIQKKEEKNQNIFIIFCGNLRIHLKERKKPK